MYRKKEFNLDATYQDHLYSGILGKLMRYCHKKLENFESRKIYSQVLEIGSGTEPHLQYIKHDFDDYYVAETSEYALNFFKDNTKMKIVKYDGKKLPFNNESFDRIIISHALEHINNPEAFIMEMMSKLKKNGVLSISLPTDPGLLWRLGRFVIKIFKLKRNFKLSNEQYDYNNAIEHINSIYNLRAIIRYHFKNSMEESFLPLKIKIPDLNLFYNVHISKSSS